MKKTMIVGASTNPSRYSYKAAHRLTEKGFDIVPIGVKKGAVAGVEILNTKEEVGDIHTVTMYVNPGIQEEYKEYIKSLNPERVIFNPGTENQAFEKELKQLGVEVENNCTLVMLSLGNY